MLEATAAERVRVELPQFSRTAGVPTRVGDKIAVRFVEREYRHISFAERRFIAIDQLPERGIIGRFQGTDCHQEKLE